MVFAIGIIVGVTFVQVYDAFFSNGSLSDEEVYEQMKEEYLFFIKVSGLEDKSAKELVVHFDNHKPRIFNKISKLRPKICNGSSLL